MGALDAAVRLNASLDAVATALAAPDADALLAAEAGLASTLADLSAPTGVTPADRERVVALVARARATLARCRVLGESLTDVARIALAAQGQASDYSRSGGQGASRPPTPAGAACARALMAGLFTTLSMTARALDAQRAGLTVTGENIANLNTNGYARRTLLLAESLIGGVDVQGVRARRDYMLDARVRQEVPAEAREAALAEALGVAQTALGTAGESLDARLSAFFDSFSALSADPSSAVARDAVLQQGRLLARSFNDIAGRLAAARRDADAQVRAGVDDLNALAGRVARLNESIGRANAGEVEALRDERDVALQQLAELADVSVVRREDGVVDVSIAGGRALVVGASSYQVEVSSTPPNGLAAISIGGADITTAIARGRIAGAIDARDTRIPGYQARLDDLAFGVAQQVNTVHQTGFDLNGNPGQVFFAPLAGAAGAAAALQLDAAIDADPSLVAASGTGAPGDNQVARALADLRDARTMAGGTATFNDSWGQLVCQVASDTQTALAEQQSRHAISTQVELMRDQVSGVSLDEESANMLKFQRAYEANARFFSTVNSVLDTLLNVVGVS